ncbi:hypothetical protein GEMRC1_009030 [Eukaryota sp. GEM-RC1]
MPPTSDQALIASLCKTIAGMRDDIAEWEPQRYINSIATPVLNTVGLIVEHSALLGPVGSALGTLFSTIKTVKLNKTQSAVLASRVLRLTKLLLSPLEAHSELADSSSVSTVFQNFVQVCGKVNTIVKQHDDAKWYKKVFTIEKYKREFEHCNKLLDDFSSELLIVFAGKTYEKLTPLSLQKIDAIIDYDCEQFQSALTTHNQALFKKLRTELREIQQEIIVASDQSIRNALVEQRRQLTEQRTNLQQEVEKSQVLDLKPTIFDDDLEIQWETSHFSGQSEVVCAEYALSDVIVKLYYGSNTVTSELAREFSILKSLPLSPSIPRIYGLALVYKNGKARHGIVMERLSSTTLKEKISTIKSPTKKLDILIRIADALSSSHEAKFLHRDLKPDNILFRGGCPVIIDWGSGKNMGSSNMSMSLNANRILTPAWASPELVAENTVYADAIDVFSFGLIAVFVLTKKSIWQDLESFPDRDQLIVDALKTGDIPDIPHSEDIPSSLLPLLNQCLQFKLVSRPNMSEVLSVLTAYRQNKAPADCLQLDNQPLCDYGLSLLTREYLKSVQAEVCVDIYTTALTLLKGCYSEMTFSKFKPVLSTIDDCNPMSTSLVGRKEKVFSLLRERFLAQAEIPVFNLNDLGVSDTIVDASNIGPILNDVSVRIQQHPNHDENDVEPNHSVTPPINTTGGGHDHFVTLPVNQDHNKEFIRRQSTELSSKDDSEVQIDFKQESTTSSVISTAADNSKSIEDEFPGYLSETLTTKVVLKYFAIFAIVTFICIVFPFLSTICGISLFGVFYFSKGSFVSVYFLFLCTTAVRLVILFVEVFVDVPHFTLFVSVGFSSQVFGLLILLFVTRHCHSSFVHFPKRINPKLVYFPELVWLTASIGLSLYRNGFSNMVYLTLGLLVVADLLFVLAFVSEKLQFLRTILSKIKDFASILILHYGNLFQYWFIDRFYDHPWHQNVKYVPYISVLLISGWYLHSAVMKYQKLKQDEDPYPKHPLILGLFVLGCSTAAWPAVYPHCLSYLALGLPYFFTGVPF